MMKRLAEAIFACSALPLISGADALACQMPSGISRRAVQHSAPVDPDAQVVLEASIEKREDALENGKITGDYWHTKVIRVLKGDKEIREVTQFIGNGSCGSWRPAIGGRGFMFGTLTTSPDGRRFFYGTWFSPAEASGFSWVLHGDYRGPAEYTAPQPERREPATNRPSVLARPAPANQGCGGNGLGGAC
ncbi:hypothetical protein [Bosea sp. (in: a-proteobacteria)]|jgi:hypothetical protein|uniref:hypothetical protein n=1 Tax=Bosea sp. (in: a-proteobacteria) TaxID=1871050 RepID=UPI003563CB35